MGEKDEDIMLKKLLDDSIWCLRSIFFHSFSTVLSDVRYMVVTTITPKMYVTKPIFRKHLLVMEGIPALE